MKLPSSFWINQISLFGFFALISGVLAGIVGDFFVALCQSACPAASEAKLHAIGSILGFSLVLLLLVGAIAIPGELSGIVRTYRRDSPTFSESQAMARTILLGSMAFLVWTMLVILVALSHMTKAA